METHQELFKGSISPCNSRLQTVRSLDCNINAAIMQSIILGFCEDGPVSFPLFEGEQRGSVTIVVALVCMYFE